MTGAEFKAALAALGITTQDEAAKFLAVSLRTINSYANDAAAIPEGTAKLLRLMRKLKLKPEGVK